jgi:hypothetical protein
VLKVGLLEAEAGSDYDLAFCFLLPHFIAVEPFGTDTRYVRFLQGAVAPRLLAFSGADMAIDGRLPAPTDYAACLALTLPDETYDWEVRERLVDWTAATGGESITGLAVGEKQRYRGLALVLTEAPVVARRPDDAGATFVAGRWRELG